MCMCPLHIAHEATPLPFLNRIWNQLQEFLVGVIVDLTFRITTCRSLLAIAFRT